MNLVGSTEYGKGSNKKNYGHIMVIVGEPRVRGGDILIGSRRGTDNLHLLYFIGISIGIISISIIIGINIDIIISNYRYHYWYQ